MMRNVLVVAVALTLLAGCRPQVKQRSAGSAIDYYGQNASAIVTIRTFDHFNQKKDDGYGFYVAPDLIVTTLDWVQGAFKAKVAPMDGRSFENITGYTSFDLKNNLLLLHTGKRSKSFIKVGASAVPDTAYSLFKVDGKLMAVKSAVTDSAARLLLKGGFDAGKPLFAPNHSLAGVVQKNSSSISLTPADSVASLLARRSGTVTSLYDLRLISGKVYPSYKTFSGFDIITDMGTIRIRLSNQLPEYRDNFIRLVCDQFYDSLLVHRVLKNFLIQTGAADSKFAGRDDVVGWQGPGYTLPMKVNSGLYHKRGAVAASKLPPERNPKNRSDGSQFYIVSGRIFTSDELNDLEREKGIKFTTEQRNVYTTVGGAPYLDGDYTVFAEVVSGMDVVDRISAVDVYNVDRPVKDIRIRKIVPVKVK